MLSTLFLLGLIFVSFVSAEVEADVDINDEERDMSLWDKPRKPTKGRGLVRGEEDYDLFLAPKCNYVSEDQYVYPIGACIRGQRNGKGVSYKFQCNANNRARWIGYDTTDCTGKQAERDAAGAWRASYNCLTGSPCQYAEVCEYRGCGNGCLDCKRRPNKFDFVCRPMIIDQCYGDEVTVKLNKCARREEGVCSNFYIDADDADELLSDYDDFDFDFDGIMDEEEEETDFSPVIEDDLDDIFDDARKKGAMCKRNKKPNAGRRVIKDNQCKYSKKRGYLYFTVSCGGLTASTDLLPGRCRGVKCTRAEEEELEAQNALVENNGADRVYAAVKSVDVITPSQTSQTSQSSFIYNLSAMHWILISGAIFVLLAYILYSKCSHRKLAINKMKEEYQALTSVDEEAEC